MPRTLLSLLVGLFTLALTSEAQGRQSAIAVAPGQPGTPSAVVSGSSVTISWAAPGTGGAPTHYLIVAGNAPGGTNLGTHNVGAVTSLTASLANGTYYLRIIAVNADGQSPESAEGSFTVGAAGGPPGTPGTPAVTVNGSTVTITWTQGSGPPPTHYLIYAGSTSGGIQLGVHNVGPATSLTTTLSTGVYFIRISAVNAAGESPQSGEASWTIGATGAPGVPGTPVATVNGNAVTVTWTPPTTGGVPTYYLVLAGTTPGGSQLGTFNVGNTLSASGTLGAGTYYVRVIAVNDAGQSPQSGERSFTIGGGGGPGNLDGTWQGTTGQGVAIHFIVSGGQITQIRMGGVFGSCTGSTQVGTTTPINGNTFTHTRANQSGSVGWTTQGTFTSSSTATGSLTATATPGTGFSCSGTVNTTWTATNYGVGAPLLPRAPFGFNASVSSTTVSFSWFAPFESDPPVADYVLEIGTTSGGSEAGVFTIPAPATAYQLTSLGPGTYFARLKARNASGVSPASTQVSFTIVNVNQYDGTWTGTTSQSRPITFTVLNGRLTAISLGYSISGSGCTTTGTVNTTGLNAPVTASGFFVNGTAANLTWNAGANSMTPTTASGNLAVTSTSGCFGFTSGVTWTATK